MEGSATGISQEENPAKLLRPFQAYPMGYRDARLSTPHNNPPTATMPAPVVTRSDGWLNPKAIPLDVNSITILAASRPMLLADMARQSPAVAGLA